MGPEPMTGVLIRRESADHRNTEGRPSCVDSGRDSNNASTSQGMSRMAGHPQKVGRSMEQILPHWCQRNPALPTPWFQISSLYNCKWLDFSCFKPLSPWHLDVAPQKWLHSKQWALSSSLLQMGNWGKERVSSAKVHSLWVVESGFCLFLAVLNLGCSMQDFWSWLQHAGSLVAAWKLSVEACGV